MKNDDIGIYLNLIATSLLGYWVSCVINMDQTRINTFFTQRKTVVPRVLEAFKTKDDGKSLKEGTTYIRTTSF